MLISVIIIKLLCCHSHQTASVYDDVTGFNIKSGSTVLCTS